MLYISCSCQAPLADTGTLSCVVQTSFELRLAFSFCNWNASNSITEGCATREEHLMLAHVATITVTTQGDLSLGIPHNNNNNLQAFQLIIVARYLLGVPKP